MSRHSLNTETLQTLLNYLATKPYAEVANLVTAIQTDAVAIEDKATLEVVQGSITDVTDVA